MKLYYAVGGGLGHLSRAIAFIHTRPDLNIDNTIVMLADRDIYQMEQAAFMEEKWRALRIAPIPLSFFKRFEKLSAYLKNWVNDNVPDQIYLDTFPEGIMGEWNFEISKPAQLHYVGRYLNWPNYQQPVFKSFDTLYKVDDWHPEQQSYLPLLSPNTVEVKLQYPEAKVPGGILTQFQQWKEEGKDIWLVVHSEPAEEVEALLHYARDVAKAEQTSPVFVLCSQSKVDDKQLDLHLSLFPAYGLFVHVDKIVTAGGFNLMQQAKHFRDKHRCMPFPRRFDDQFMRVRIWKA
ncbi:hypothetical protein OKW21_000366 [Catalinimonas alkaloidigena]|uniref:hypothetical protein n=1 Tax=Catalinimonas alkaloidigena TaxID=1075417 RepID=UPI002406522B|nr:hypothetical protein [Catalinimonas alkaloidigena]MDF9795103.1 hypothetical protein [Catalinimonas alkaloidigena]